MELFLLIPLSILPILMFFIPIVLIGIVINNLAKNNTIKTKPQFKYTKKNTVITKAELAFFQKLEKCIGEHQYIIPQAHLSIFLDHHVKGQNWRIAFSQINQKSVDFLVCEKNTMRPLFAIELDDKTHEAPDRITRDNFVNQVLQDAGVPLYRFKAGEWDSEEMIKHKIVTTFQQATV